MAQLPAAPGSQAVLREGAGSAWDKAASSPSHGFSCGASAFLYSPRSRWGRDCTGSRCALARRRSRGELHSVNEKALGGHRGKMPRVHFLKQPIS